MPGSMHVIHASCMLKRTCLGLARSTMATGSMLDKTAAALQCIRMDIMPERVLKTDNRMHLLLSSVC